MRGTSSAESGDSRGAEASIIPCSPTQKRRGLTRISVPPASSESRFSARSSHLTCGKVLLYPGSYRYGKGMLCPVAFALTILTP